MSTDTPGEKTDDASRSVTEAPPSRAPLGGRAKRILKSSLAFVVVRFASVIVSIATIPLALKVLGEERYGLWMALSGIVQMLAFADLGLGSGLMNIVAAEGPEGTPKVRKALSDTFFSLLAIVAAWTVIALVVVPMIPWARLFGVRTPLAIAEAQPAVWALLGCTFVNIPLSLVNRLQLGRQEAVRNAIAGILNTVGQFVGTVAALKLNLGLPWVILWFTAPLAIGNGINMAIELFRRHPELRPRLSDWSYAESMSLAKIGLNFLLLQALTSLTQWSDYVIVGNMVGAKANAAYSVAFRVFSVALLSAYMTRSLWPAFTEAVAKDDFNWAARLFGKVNRINLAFGVVGGIVLPFIATAIIGKWVGKGLSVPMDLLLAFGAWLLVMNLAEGLTALSMADLFRKVHTLYFSAAAIGTFVLRIILVRVMGTPGVVYGAVVCYGLLYVIPMFFVMRARLQIESDRVSGSLQTEA